ncbi:hypothetical protein F7725_016953, partial [Dissostichus mawsoni]
MASSIPPPEPMKMAGDIHGNWTSFRAEFEDYLLATGLSEKEKRHSTNTSAQPQSMRDAGECKYCGTRHKRGRDLCPAFGKSCRSCGTANHFAKVCMKRGQQARQLNAVDDPLPGELEDSDERDVYTAESVGAVNTQGKKWFVNLPLQSGVQRCQLDSGATCNVMSIKDKTRLAPRTPLLKSLTRLKLYNRVSKAITPEVVAVFPADWGHAM